MADERTPEEREIDHETEGMSVFWWNGYRAHDHAPWYDGGMKWLEADREGGSGCEGMEGEELRDAMLAKDDAALGWALGMGEPVSATEAMRESASHLRLEPELSPDWRLVFDDEREVFVAAHPDGIRIAPLEVVWEGPGTPVSIVKFGPLVPWTTGRKMRNEIDPVARARRQTYEYCKRCGVPNPPEHMGEEDEGLVCHSCLEKAGTVH